MADQILPASSEIDALAARRKTLPRKNNVLRLVPRVEREPEVCADTVLHLETLLKHAKTGRITGLAWVAVERGRGFCADVAGDAQRSPTWTRGALRALDDKLADRVRATRVHGGGVEP